MALQHWTNAQIIEQLDYEDMGFHFEWTGSTITYAFPSTAAGMDSIDNSELPGFSAMDTGTQAKLRLALQLWDDLIATTFVETNSANSDIEMGFTTTGVAFGQTYFPDMGSLWLNSTFNTGINDLVAANVGSHGFVTYLHELGHAMGVDHMGDYNGAGTITPSCYQDSSVYTVMSYFGPSAEIDPDVAMADWTPNLSLQSVSPQTPMLSDVLAIQSMYGTSATTRTGDTVYGFNCSITGTTRDIYSFVANPSPVLTLFDSSGNDTLDLSGWNFPSQISLVPGTFSSGNAMDHNIWIAYSCMIENAVGGSGSDTITGNTAANRLTGNGGNDTMDGGAGLDTAVFSGTRGSYGISGTGGNANWQVTGPSGNDHGTSIERLVFNDSGVAFDLSGNAGMVARIIGVVFGAAEVHNETYVGIGLGLADGGMAYADLMRLALNVAVGSDSTNEEVVSLLYSNVAGVAPSPSALALYTGMISGGTFTQATLGVMAAETDINAGNIGLTGLATTGLFYA